MAVPRDPALDPLPSHSAYVAVRSPVAWLTFAATAGIGLGLDLWTKYLSFGKFAHFADDGTFLGGDVYEFIPKWLHFTALVNRGAVFGIGQGKQTLFVAVSVLAIAFLVFLFTRSGKRVGYQFLLGLLLAGVIGNFYDRVKYDYVRDMIHLAPGVPNPLRSFFPRWDTIFPWVFNLADSYLCVGVGLMLLHSLFYGDDAKTPQPAPNAAAPDPTKSGPAV
jgi:signal peptidase II